MKREIKFRAWDKENEVLMYLDEPETKWEFTEKGLTVSYLNEIHYEGGGEIHTKYEWEVLDCEIMQFTGLLDKNGKEIYEGDIIKALGVGRKEFVNTIEFHKGCFMRIHKEYPQDPSYLYDAFGWEVIGNIHQKP